MVNKKSIKRTPKYSKRELRSFLSKAKKLGAINPKINAGTVKLTEYRRRQVSALMPVLKGEADFVKINKTERELYTKKTAARKFGSGLIVPKERLTQKTDVITAGDGKQYIRIKVPLKNGEMVKIALPYSASNLFELAVAIQDDETLPDQIFYDYPNDRYSFSVLGESSMIGFATKKLLTDYILQNYKHLFSYDGDVNITDTFCLVHYSASDTERVPEIPESMAGPKYRNQIGLDRNPRYRAYDRNGWYEKRQRETKNLKRKNARAKLKEKNPDEYKRQSDAAKERVKRSREKQKKRDFNNASFGT